MRSIAMITDRVGGPRNGDRQVAQGLLSLIFDAEEVPPTRVRGCGNVGPMEITKRFPQDLANLAQNARFAHSHKPILSIQGRRT
jgi:hypothetical protein